MLPWVAHVGNWDWICFQTLGLNIHGKSQRTGSQIACLSCSRPPKGPLLCVLQGAASLAGVEKRNGEWKGRKGRETATGRGESVYQGSQHFTSTDEKKIQCFTLG